MIEISSYFLATVAFVFDLWEVGCEDHEQKGDSHQELLQVTTCHIWDLLSVSMATSGAGATMMDYKKPW